MRLLGYVTNSYKFSLIKDAHVLLMPSIWCENNPLTIIESFAFAKPIVTFNICGQSEIVNVSKGGVTAKYLDVEDYAEKIALLIHDHSLYRDLCINAGEFFKKELNPFKYRDKLIKLYLT